MKLSPRIAPSWGFTVGRSDLDNSIFSNGEPLLLWGINPKPIPHLNTERFCLRLFPLIFATVQCEQTHKNV